jgi:hypothetical protein
MYALDHKLGSSHYHSQQFRAIYNLGQHTAHFLDQQEKDIMQLNLS